MKPNEEETKKGDGEEPPVAGDIIGDTAYSQRFVLKILLKFANLDSFKEELAEDSFEEDLCTLWDMTAEKDVVEFLLKHDLLNLVSFVLPSIENPRIFEIIIGIIGNMCCCEETIKALYDCEDLLITLIKFIKSDDSLVLIQIVRFVNSCLYLVKETDVQKWLDLFESTEYNSALSFILQNSCHHDLQFNALENLNTICFNCNTESCHTKFFDLFVNTNIIDGLHSSFNELTDHYDDSQEEELQRILLISLQISLVLVGFNKSPELYTEKKVEVSKMILFILKHYKEKIIEKREIDTDIVDIVESVNSITEKLKLNETFIDKHFYVSYDIWKATKSFGVPEKSDLEDIGSEVENKIENLNSHLCIYLANFMANCEKSCLEQLLNNIEGDYEEIIKSITDETILNILKDKASDNRTRLKENVDS